MDLPTREMVINEQGQPVWRICGRGICVETPSGATAQAEFEALCSSIGLEPPTDAPERGPSDVDEPGV
jgi:hypothetical protein